MEPKKLNRAECVTLAIGGMVGSAIFALSGFSYRMAGPAIIISWVIAALILLAYGLMTAELVTIYPDATGGMFEYPYRTLGKSETGKKAWGWFASWSLLNVNLFGAGFSAIYIANYFANMFPSMMKEDFSGAKTNYVIIFAIVAAVLFGILCLFNVTIAGKVNLVMVAGLLLILAVFVIACFTHGFSGANFSPFFVGGQVLPGIEGLPGYESLNGNSFVTAIPTAMLAYGAIVSTAFMSSQVKDPKKTVPATMKIAMAIVVISYVITLVAMIGKYAWAQFAFEPFSEYSTIINIAQSIAPVLKIVVSIAAILALASTMLVLMMMAGWQLQSTAAKGMLPIFLAKVNPKTNTPIAAMVIVTIAVAALACFPNLVSQITNCGGICNAIAVVIIAITLLAARKKPGYQAKSEDYRLGGGPIIPIAVVILVLVFILPVVFQALENWLWALGWFALGIVLFFIFLATGKKKA